MTTAYRGKIQGVIFDWAGTMVDYGCFAPLLVFVNVFKFRGIEITAEEARGPMGMLKRDHIKALLEMEHIAGMWKERYGKAPAEADVDELYADFEPMLFADLARYTDPVPGALEVAAKLREQGLKIGSTTGYTAQMMKIVASEAKSKGYAPDTLVTPDDVSAGRPHPWMCYRNAELLGIYPMAAMVKVGDTISDIQEGVNAGMWSVGIIKGGSELGLSESEVSTIPADELASRIAVVTDRFRAAGAHYIIEEISGLPAVIEQINARLAEGGMGTAG
ncbi:phosphonoacetaldehyde hydrolase [Paenibacillus mendelii]|uniref:Phosphonoacetaldehyde hydrolase n=1 Tax=Paenibacillus mendelii TaxID=206163 RepID=A0ABV6J484_9BACL|nr:phosphonoacetaldehyde hydrolase [Paenibacillus mendelii]MCQ6561781.1 phosphonoacetaldehyde hydrolase [Paenibacillus mendelii]